MKIKGFIELHDYYEHKPVLVKVNSIDCVRNGFIVFAESGHNVEESYETIIKLMEEATNESERT